MKKVLVVEDVGIAAHFIQNVLEKIGYICVGPTDNFEEAIELVESSSPDIALLDIAIKGKYDGVDIANKLVNKYGVKVIFITAHHDEHTLARAMNCSPQNYLIKPIEAHDIQVALQLVELSPQKVKSPTLKHLGNKFYLDLQGAKVIYEGRDITLTKKEFLLLSLLSKKGGCAVSFQELSRALWPKNKMNLNSLRNIVNSLREKLAGVVIESIRGVGYKLIS